MRHHSSDADPRGSTFRKRRTLTVTQVSVEEDSCREVSDRGHLIVWRTDRLGMPLIEMVTGPDLRTPEEVEEAILLIGRVCRLTGHVRVGLGASREDVNVSVGGGRASSLAPEPSASAACACGDWPARSPSRRNRSAPSPRSWPGAYASSPASTSGRSSCTAKSGPIIQYQKLEESPLRSRGSKAATVGIRNGSLFCLCFVFEASGSCESFEFCLIRGIRWRRLLSLVKVPVYPEGELQTAIVPELQ